MVVSLESMPFQKTQWNKSHINYKIKVESSLASYLYTVDILCNSGKTVNQLLFEDISSEIEIEYRASEENDEFLDNNDVSMSHIIFLYEEAKRNHLIGEISRNLHLELKGLVAQQCIEIKHEIQSMYEIIMGKQ